MSGSWIPIVSALLVFAAIVYIGYLIREYQLARMKRRSLAMVTGYAKQDVHTAIAEVDAEPSPVMLALLTVGRRLAGKRGLERLDRQLLFAGESEVGAVDSLVIRKFIFGVIGLLLGLLLGLSSGGLLWLTVPGFALFGFFAMDFMIYNRGLKRDEEMARRLPDALDMLNLCVESGLSFQSALNQVAINQTGPVAEEFALVLREMQLGRSRGQAIEALGGRTNQEDIQRFVSAMLQVDKLGVPVAVVLREQAKEMRAKRYARAREQAQKVPVKILMPLMLCFLPALFIIILGPAVYSIVQVFSDING